MRATADGDIFRFIDAGSFVGDIGDIGDIGDSGPPPPPAPIVGDRGPPATTPRPPTAKLLAVLLRFGKEDDFASDCLG